jgi:hypothetical protein
LIVVQSTMAIDQTALLELFDALKGAGVDDRVRIAAQSMYQALIDAEAEGVIGAGFWERTSGRASTGNGSRQLLLATTAGDLELRIPKLRTESLKRSRGVPMSSECSRIPKPCCALRERSSSSCMMNGPPLTAATSLNNPWLG